MTKRAFSGRTITRRTRRAALPLETPLFPGYNPSTATNYAEKAPNAGENGPYGQLFAISTTFFRNMNLMGRKTAKILNNGLLGTTHKLSLGITSYTRLHYRAWPVGRSQSPDVRQRL